jgi:hypothetical protein
MTRTLRFVVGVCIVFAFQIHHAFADRIVGVTATTTMGTLPGLSLANTLNGVGLSAVSLTATHGPTSPSNSWVSVPGTLTGTVTFTLGGTYQVDRFSFWNQNGGGPGFGGTTGVQGVQVLTSTDGVSFFLLPGGPSLFAQVPATVAPPEIFTFAPVTATHFRFNILSNYGFTSSTGFAEVGFNSVSSVPEPATVGLLIGGLIMGLLGVRRIRSHK